MNRAMTHTLTPRRFFLKPRLRLAPLALAALLAGCVTTGPNQNPAQAIGEALKTLAASGGGAAPAGSATTGAGQNQTANLIQLLMQSVDQIDEPREIEIGRQLSAILLGSKALHPDQRLQRYVNQLGRWISLQSARPQLAWTFVVLDDPGFNAFAAPGGYVFVTKGLVDQARGEAELGGVLAHEIAHVVQKHHLKALNKTARAGLVAQLAASQLKTDTAGQVAAQLLNLGKDLYARGLDRDDEFEADRLGVTLATRAGLDPYGLPSLLHSLAEARPDSPTYALALSTHPPTDQRLQRLEQAMGNRLDAYVDARPVTIAQRLGGTAARVPAPAAVTPVRPATPATTRPAGTAPATVPSTVRPASGG